MKPPDQADAAIPLRGSGTNRSFYLPRLPREYYQADAVIHWTMPIAMRGTGWLSDPFHAHFRETMLHAAAREGLFCPTYCLMPDHIHLVWMGLRRDTAQKNGMKFLREHLAPPIAPVPLPTSGARPRLEGRTTRTQRFRQGVFLHHGQGAEGGFGCASQGMEILRRSHSRLPDTAISVGGGFLADVLEALPGRACSRRRRDYAAAILICSRGRNPAQTSQHAPAIDASRRRNEPTHVGGNLIRQQRTLVRSNLAKCSCP